MGTAIQAASDVPQIAMQDRSKQTLASGRVPDWVENAKMPESKENETVDDSLVVVVLTPPPHPSKPPTTPPALDLVGPPKSSNEPKPPPDVDLNDRPSGVEPVDMEEEGSAEENTDPAVPPPTTWMEWSWVEVARGDVWGASGAGVGLAPGGPVNAAGSLTPRFGPVGRVVGSVRSFDVISLPSDRATTPFSAMGLDDEIPSSMTASCELDRPQHTSDHYHVNDTGHSTTVDNPSLSTSTHPLLSPPFRPLHNPSPHSLETSTHGQPYLKPPTPPPILSINPQKSFSPTSPTIPPHPPRSATPTHIANLLARVEMAAAAAAASAPAAGSPGGVNMQRSESGAGSACGSGSEAGFGKRRRKRRSPHVVSGGKTAADDTGPGQRKEKSIWKVWWDGVTMWGVQIVKGDGDWQWAVVKIFGAVLAAGVGGYVLIRLGSSCQKRLAILFGGEPAHERV